MILHGRASYIIFSDYYMGLCIFICHENMGYLKIFLLLDLQSILTVTYVDTKRATVIEFYYQLRIDSFNRTSFETFNMQTITRYYKKRTWEDYMFQVLKDVTVWNPACEISGLVESPGECFSLHLSLLCTWNNPNSSLLNHFEKKKVNRAFPFFDIWDILGMVFHCPLVE